MRLAPRVPGRRLSLGSKGVKMAARWGAGEETLTIGGMELFTASGPLQCNDLDEDESCHDLTDLGILGTLQGYIDNSIISIIDDSGTQTENKGHFDEGNELSLLTALTEILDNADDENMSPFDSIPDTELLVSPKDRDGCSRFLSLSRTPPDREITSMDDQHWVNYAKVDILCPGSNWDLFPETITSTPMRRTRHKSVRAYLPRRARAGHILQRSDGEEEDQSQFSSLLPADNDSSLDPDDEIVDYDNDRLMKHGAPCIINTANVPLSDLVKYMHPYCLPAITLCLDPEDENILDEDQIFLEIVSDHGESIKVPIMVEDPGEAIDVQSSEDDVFVLNTLAGVDRQPKYLLALESSSSEQCVPEVDVNYEKNGELMEEKELLKQSIEDDEIMESKPVEDKIMEVMPVEDKIMEALPVEDKIMEVLPVEDKIMEVLPVDDKIMEALPVEDKIMEALPVDKIMEALPLEDKIMEALPLEDKIMEALPLEDKIMEALPVEDKIMEVLPVEDKIMEALPVEDKIMEVLPVEDKIMEAVPLEDKIMEAVPEVEKMSTESLNAEGTVDILDNEAPADADASNLNRKPKNEDLIVPDKEKVSKGKKSIKDKHLKSSKSKAKSKNKGAGEVKPPEVQEIVSPPNTTQSAASRSSNPSLQESDFLTKTLDQVVESQFDLRSSKMPRNKARSRPSIDIPEKKVNLENNKKAEKPTSVETEQPKSNMEAGVDHVLETNDKAGELCSQSDVVQEHVPNDKSEAHCDVSAAADANSEDTSSMEPNETAVKELKPKSLSLTEYRKRLQTRKPNPDREPESSSCSKWPSLPEPPTELAELPCLLVPSKTDKPTLQEKPSLTGPESCCAQVAPATSSMLPPIVPVAPVATWEGFPQKITEEPSFPIMDTTLPPMMPAQPNLPPPFYPPVWSGVPSQQPYYPGVPPLSVPQFPNTLPPMMPMQPPPSMMSWPPFPPPPIGMGPVHPNTWASGFPPPYWSTPPVPQGMPEAPVPFNTGGQLGVAHQMISQNAAVPPRECSPQKQQMSAKDCKSGTKDRKTAEAPGGNKSGVAIKNATMLSKPGLQVCSEVKKSESPLAQVKPSVPADPKAASVSIPDLKSTNDVVIKIMEILKKAQKCGFQIKPPLPSSAQKTEKPAEAHKPAEVTVLKSAEKASGGAQGRPTPVIVQPSALTAEQPKLEAPAKEAKTLPSSTVGEKPVQASALHPIEALCTPSVALNPNLPVSNQKEQAEGLDCESGIEACDLTSLLEEFEKSAAKDEERLPPSPDKMAVGNSGSEQPMGKKPPAEKHLAPELVNTAGLTPPATPPHQLWKSVSQPLNGTPVPVTAQEKPCASVLKTAKLIEPKPLPQSKLRSRTLPPAPSVVLPAVHVGSGDHDYCILSATQQQKVLETVESGADATQREEGSRWNVKHHQNIVIKPIVQFSKRPQNTPCPKQSAPNVPPVNVKSANGGPAHPVVPPPCVNIQKDSNEPLDHRTNVLSESAVKSPPGSVLLSPDSSPCRSEIGETRTDARSEKPSVSRRSLRCYRKFRNSPSPQKSKRRGRSSGSRSASSSSSSSSSSSRSRSRSPPMKRRRNSLYSDNYGFVTYRYTSEAFAAIENGHKLQLPDEMPFDLCFGGRRQFCKSNYADLDSNRGEFDDSPVRSKFEGVDFDTLLREAQKKQRR
ncbi:peroxisome proliferator-activated receptor gamma coactivator-related protein 1 [Rana temporaria]|uniref:peroxisome proliferator-activated receptor gamma coactivator-related protein 1 n=1 Tax=Rana temporaria TaxID=8407 RepID=UPI001AAD57F7|nr:peroxisome proliferator-activated receptor gamma coactivator-related protein 1 [Rana temporaria]